MTKICLFKWRKFAKSCLTAILQTVTPPIEYQNKTATSVANLKNILRS